MSKEELSTNPKPRRGAGLIAFVLGVLLGRMGLRPITHILYLVAILITFMFAQGGPINAYLAEYAKEAKVQQQIEKAVQQAVPELENMKKVSNQLHMANKSLNENFQNRTKQLEGQILKLENNLEVCERKLNTLPVENPLTP